jgi:hypothetical protein
MTLHAGAFCVKMVVTMKIPAAFFSMLLLAACSRQPVEPTGVYRLGTAEKTLVLDVRASGEYVLQIDGPDSMTDEIRGRWENEGGKEMDVTFHGIVWRGNEPEPGHAMWPVKFENDGGICIDGEGFLCFTKDAAARTGTS